ncbi:MAG: ComEC/Rec2 family competence protein [Limnochordaceae bacterium]|nr:ComEC/Rec2 family competence protein [Limnochordaceae bacterium]
MKRRPWVWLGAAWSAGVLIAWRQEMAAALWLGTAATGAVSMLISSLRVPSPLRLPGVRREGPGSWRKDVLLLAATALAGAGAWSSRVEVLSFWPLLQYRSVGAERQQPVQLEAEVVDLQGLPPHREPGWQIWLRPWQARAGTRQWDRVSTPALSRGQVLLTVYRDSCRFFEALTPAERAIAQLRPGDRLCAAVELRLPSGGGNPGQFRYATYLARHGVLAVAYATPGQVQVRRIAGPLSPSNRLRRTLFQWRQRAVAVTGEGLDWPYQGMLQGIFWGDRQALPAAVQETFTRSGVSHLLAVSGLNVALVAAAAMVVGRRLGWGGAGLRWVTALLVGGYVLLVGAGGSAARAGLMAMFGLALGKRQGVDPLNLLGAAGLFLAIVNPFWVFDVGLLLSLAATAGLILWTRPLAQLGCKWLPWLPVRWHQSWAFSVAAWLSTLPLVWSNFGEVSPYGVVTNLVVVPLAAWLVPLAGWRCLIRMLPLPYAGRVVDQFLAQALEVGLRLLWWVLQQVGAWPGSLLRLPPWSPWSLLGLGSLALLVAGTDVGRDPFRYLGRRDRLGGVDRRVVAGFILALALSGPRWQTDRHLLRVWFVDVGQGDAALIQAPGQMPLLVDGGPAAAGPSLREFVKRQVGGAKVGLVVSHPHSDHEQGLIPIVENQEARWLVHGDWSSGERSTSAIRDCLRWADLPEWVVKQGDQGQWGNSVYWQVLWPPHSGEGAPPAERAGLENQGNDHSLAFTIGYGRVCLLFPGDMERSGQAAWLREPGPVSPRAGTSVVVLKAPHHGADSAWYAPFVDFWNPRAAVISVGRNGYGQPGSTFLAGLEQREVAVWRTDLQGAVRLRTDGRRVWIAARAFDPTQLRFAHWEERSF